MLTPFLLDNYYSLCTIIIFVCIVHVCMYVLLFRQCFVHIYMDKLIWYITPYFGILCMGSSRGLTFNLLLRSIRIVQAWRIFFVLGSQKSTMSRLGNLNWLYHVPSCPRVHQDGFLGYSYCCKCSSSHGRWHTATNVHPIIPPWFSMCCSFTFWYCSYVIYLSVI